MSDGIAQGRRLESPDAVFGSIDAVVDYRGDVTIARHDGTTVEGYVFDCVDRENPATAQVRLLPRDGGSAVSIAMKEIAALDVTGRDTAAGKSFETWVRKYVAKMRDEGRL